MTDDQATLQRLEALVNANAVRTARATDKKLIKAGKKDPALIILNPPTQWQTAKVIDLLLAMPKVGQVKANKWLRMHQVPATKPIEDLSTRQRNSLHRHMNVVGLKRDRVRHMLEDAA
jgi:hypothetical protein